MKKKLLFVIVLLIILVGVVGVVIYKSNDKEEVNSDALKFKEEYESLNGTTRESDGALYNDVEITEDNPIKYVTVSEAVDIIKNETAIIYFGANWCPWCRNAVEVLFDAAEENNIDTIYYLDMTDVRNIWDVEDGELIKTQEEQDGYYDLLDALDSILGDDTYTLTDDDITYDTGEKRVYIPLVVAVSNGEILSYHEGTVSLDNGQTKYDKLTTSQYDELYSTYNKLINTIKYANVCSEDNC